MINEDQLEQLAIDWFREQGYDYAHGPDISPDGEHAERPDYRQVILQAQLISALQTVNPEIPLEKHEQPKAPLTWMQRLKRV